MKRYYIFDLDGTLVFTDALNNESSNVTLEKYGLSAIKTEKRITRKLVEEYYPHISPECLKSIICQKQQYFNKNLNKIHINNFVFDILTELGRNNCYLWTAADDTRLEGIASEYGLRGLFRDFFVKNKENIAQNIIQISTYLECKICQLAVFENDNTIVQELINQGASCFLFFAGSGRSLT